MSDLICQIVTRKIYAYVAEIFGGPAFWNGKWHLCDEKKFKHYYVEWEDGETDIRSEFRKATVEEIIKHFKKS